MNPRLQAHGAHVLKFGRMVPNFGRIGELTNAILEMLRSQDWRDYVDATGEYHFRPGEFDFFLAEHAVAASDLPRLYLKPPDKIELMAAMDRGNEDSRYRRTFEAIVHAHPRGSLSGNWARYGWAKTKHPVGYRAAVRARTGVTLDERTRETRKRSIHSRRSQLDQLVDQIARKTRNDTELRYVIDELHQRVGKPGRPPSDQQEWARDVKAFKGDAKALAKHWKLGQSATYTRIQQITNNTRINRKAS